MSKDHNTYHEIIMDADAKLSILQFVNLFLFYFILSNIFVNSIASHLHYEWVRIIINFEKIARIYVSIDYVSF